MDSRQGAVDLYGRPQFLQGQVRFAAQQRLHLPVMGAQNKWFAPRKTVTRSDVSGTPALLQEFLNQAQRDTETMGNFFTVSFLLVVGTEDSFTQVQGYGSHERILPPPEASGYSFI
jgi:hypothetical protein